jgi:hypothetical protein
MHALHTPSTARTPLHNYILHHVHNYYIMNERLAHHVNHPLQLILRNDCVPYWSYMSAFMTFRRATSYNLISSPSSEMIDSLLFNLYGIPNYLLSHTCRYLVWMPKIVTILAATRQAGG